MEEIFENRDESFLRWRMNVEENDKNIVEDDECGSEQLLKTVVRTSYLYHLRQSLRKNVEIAKQKNSDIVHDNIVNKIIKGCSALLEETALRSCMIAKLYQRVMAQTIKDVKKASSESQLYCPLKEFAERQSKIPATSFVDKEIQTDVNNIVFTNQIADLYNQTQQLLHKISSVPNNINEMNSSNFSSSTIKSTQNDNNFINDIQTIKIRSEKNAEDCFLDNENELDKIDDKNLNDANGEKKHVLSKRRKNYTYEKPIHEDPLKTINDNVMNGFVMEPAADKNDSFEVKLKSFNFTECIAFWYNLECELEDLPPFKKQKIEEKFIQLFGKDHGIDYYFLTDEQKLITCRKRIAKFVVIELTDYYSKKRIGSKQLFKTLAKHITSILLGRSLYPDPTEIKKSVEEFFIDDRIIRTEDDFYI